MLLLSFSLKGMLVSTGSVVAVIFLFSLAVFIHEFGHFLAARLLGMKVDAFSIGFGPALWKKRINGIEYRLSAILFGGYVALPQLDPAGMEKLQGGAAEEGKEATADAAPWKRIIVAIAGPFGNVVLAVVIALILAASPKANFNELGTEIGFVIPGMPAAEAGVLAGERVTAVNGRKVSSWYEMQTEIQIAGTRTVSFDLSSPSNTARSVMITPERDEVSGASCIGLFSVTSAVHAASWMPVRNPFGQLKWDACAIARTLEALVSPKSSGSVAHSLVGPVGISQIIYNEVQRNGWDTLGFLRFLCINLAILNLLPIPVLDGGHVMFALYEIFFRRKPSRRVVGVLVNGFAYVIIALFVFLVWRDCNRMWRYNRAKASVEAESSADTVPSADQK